nr:MAG TPA: hypothetical protein [Caudoviricetes sp.]
MQYITMLIQGLEIIVNITTIIVLGLVVRNLLGKREG